MVLGNTPQEDRKIVSFEKEAWKRGISAWGNDPSIPLRKLALENGLHQEDFPPSNKELPPELWEEIQHSVENYGVEDFLPFTDIPEDLREKVNAVRREVILARLWQVSPRR